MTVPSSHPQVLEWKKQMEGKRKFRLDSVRLLQEHEGE